MLQQARSYLRQADPVLARLIDERPDFDPRAWMTQLPPMDLYGALLFQVTGQQLSVAATRRTLARIEDLFGGRSAHSVTWPSGSPMAAWTRTP
jgi:DNA-3-methyladenine glycosylase II